MTATKHSVILLFSQHHYQVQLYTLQIIKPALLAPHHKEHFTGETSMPQQCAKKVVSDSLGLVDFAIGLVNSVLNLLDGQVKYFEKFNSRKDSEISSAPQKMLGAS